MDFIYDIDFVASLIGSIIDFFPQAPNILNTGVAGSIDFDDIQSSAFGYCLAHGAGVAWLALALIGKAVHRFGQDTSGAGLACAPGATEKVSMRYTVTTQSI